jgi:hypothetical protein
MKKRRKGYRDWPHAADVERAALVAIVGPRWTELPTILGFVSKGRFREICKPLHSDPKRSLVSLR